MNHLPGFLELNDEIRAKGVDTIAVVSVNDVFVMKAWAKATDAGDRILFLADGNGEFTRAAGLDVDLSGGGLGLRSKRYSMIVRDGTVAALNIEESPGQAETSSASALLRSSKPSPQAGEATLAGLRLKGSIPARANLVRALVLGVAGMPLDPMEVTSWRLRSSSRRCQSSAFLTGFLSAVRHPLRFQP